MSYDQPSRIRRAAILLASLEEALAEELVRSMPAAEVERIYAEMERLDTIDPEEQRDVLDEFRKVTRRGSAATDGVELSFSRSEPTAPDRSPAAMAMAPPTKAGLEAARPVSPSPQAPSADFQAMAELLVGEHPQTIAAVLARLDEERAAAVFAALPAELQPEIVDRLARLQPADEAAVREVESQLLRRTAEIRQEQARSAAGIELARKIVARAAPGQRDLLLARLAPKEPAAKRGEISLAHLAAPTPKPQATDHSHHPRSKPAAFGKQAENLAATVARARNRELSSNVAAAKGLVSADGPPTDSNTIPADCSRELESLSDRQLLAALKAADQQTVQRALAASSERFLKRVAGKLPREQAARLRQLVLSLGPTRIADLRFAQHELLRIARQRDEPAKLAAA